jgi:3-methyladenine DNA glycosylase Tag
VDAKTDKTLFSKVYTADPRSGVSWIYVLKNDFNYPEMLGELNKQFCNDIQPVVLDSAKGQ